MTAVSRWLRLEIIFDMPGIPAGYVILNMTRYLHDLHIALYTHVKEYFSFFGEKWPKRLNKPSRSLDLMYVALLCCNKKIKYYYDVNNI